MTIPEVFIIESLRIKDEKQQRHEGRIISEILHLGGKQSIYYYIRTKAELKEILREFKRSRYRYLHLSCHGNSSAMATTLDEIKFGELQSILCPVLKNRRLFVSACSMSNAKLAKRIIPESECYSIAGPKSTVDFNDAAILWAAFYHLMFKSNSKAMKHLEVAKYLQHVASLFGVPLNYYRTSTKSKTGFSSKLISP